MNKWMQLGAGIPVAGAVGWGLVRFFDWRRRLWASLSRPAAEES